MDTQDGIPVVEAANMTWSKVAALMFCLLHACTVLQMARPLNLFYPKPPNDSGWTWTRQLEIATSRDGTTQLDHPTNILSWYARYFGVDQQWNTFAPVPPFLYAHYTVTRRTAYRTETVWSDDHALDRGGTGLLYNPIVKMVSLFQLPSQIFQDLFLAFVARQLDKKAGPAGATLILEARFVVMSIDKRGAVVKSEPRELELRSVQISR